MSSDQSSSVTISDAMQSYLDMVKDARSRHTMLTYKNALRIFREVLIAKKLEPDSTPIENISEDLISALAKHLKIYSPATEQVYTQAVKGFYEFIDSEHMAEINQARVRVLIRQRSRRPGFRFPQFPMDEIEHLLTQVEDIGSLSTPSDDEKLKNTRLRAYRDRAFLLTLADTGFRVHEACRLRRGDINWNEQYTIIIGKGDKQALVRFTSRSIQAMRDYLTQRAELDGSSGRQLASLPIFARHDKGAGKKVKPMTTTTGRRIVQERVAQLLGKEMVGRITPHSFRHYFVTSVLQGTGNLRYAQELARHKNIAVTERYTHLTNDELDKAYYEVFEKKQKGLKE